MLLPASLFAQGNGAKNPQLGAKRYKRSVRFVMALENRGKKALVEVELRLQLPQEIAGQRALLLELSPGATIKTDVYGNKVAVYKKMRIEPGKSFHAQWFATLELRNLDKNQEGARVVELSQEERALYLRDRKVYGVEHPLVKELAAKAVSGKKTEHARMLAIHAMVLDRLRYVRDGRWDPAPLCLERGEGSCTEYSFAFIALARAAGLPARYAGGLALRKRSEDAYEDRVFHRWVEVWLPDKGWYPLDCSRDDREDKNGKKRTPQLGKKRWHLLTLVRGDGGTGSLTKDSYHAHAFYKGRGGRSRRRGYWSVAVSPKAYERLKARLIKNPKLEEPWDAGLRQAWLFLNGKGTAPLRKIERKAKAQAKANGAKLPKPVPDKQH